MQAYLGWVRMALATATLLFLTPAVATDDNAKILAPSGTLRAALYPGTPTSILDAKESDPRGVGYELGRQLARRLGVQFEPIVYAKNTDVLEAVKTGKADVAFTNASPARQKEMNFGPPFLAIELGYLVPAGSIIGSSADVDRKGVRVGVTAGSTSEGTRVWSRPQWIAPAFAVLARRTNHSAALSRTVEGLSRHARLAGNRFG